MDLRKLIVTIWGTFAILLFLVAAFVAIGGLPLAVLGFVAFLFVAASVVLK